MDAVTSRAEQSTRHGLSPRRPGHVDYLAPVADMLIGLASTHRYDQRGCGRSSSDDGYSLERYITDLEELRAYFGYQRWFVFGHSFGASLGLLYAATHPERVRGLIYCNGVGLDWPSRRATYHERADARLSRSQGSRRDELADRQRSREEEIESRTLCWQSDYADPTLGQAFARQDALTPLDLNLTCNAALNAGMAQRPLEMELADCRRVSAPVLLVHGELDPRPIEGVQALRDALPGDARLETVGEAGHYPWRERPDAVRVLLRDFVTRRGATRPGGA